MEILIIFLLILLNGVFAMSEISLVSARKFKLELSAKRGSANARNALKLSENPTGFLSTVQIGITLIGILTGIFSGEEITGRLQLALAKYPMLAPYADTLAVVIVVVIVTYFSIVFGELIPKRIGLLFPERIATFMSVPMMLLARIARPFIWLLTVTNDFFMWMFGFKHTTQGQVTEEEIKAMVQQSAEGGEIREIEQDIVHRAFELGDRHVAELMTHRIDIVWLDVHDSIDEITRKTNSAPHTNYLVAEGVLDKLVGVVSVKELFRACLHNEPLKLHAMTRQPLILHSNTSAYLVLEKFKQARSHFGVVVDEYGSVQGVITMDDLLDALVGDVSEYDQEEYGIMQRDDHSWLVDGQYPYFELLNYFELRDEVVKGNFATVAGLLLNLAGRIPPIGEQVDWGNYTLEVVDMDGMRIDKVLITRKGK